MSLLMSGRLSVEKPLGITIKRNRLCEKYEPGAGLECLRSPADSRHQNLQMSGISTYAKK